MIKFTKIKPYQAGATLIEVLVAILVLSFGMLSLGAMLSFSVQAPKLAGYRATAANLAAAHVERMRANPTEFANGNYNSTLSYDGTFNSIALNDCTYPNCTAASLATMDIAATRSTVRAELPAGGMLVTCSTTPCGVNSHGNLWIVWQEPRIYESLNTATNNNDNCPTQVTSAFTNPAPRCLYVRFKL